MWRVFIGKRVFCECASESDACGMVRVLASCGYAFVWCQAAS